MEKYFNRNIEIIQSRFPEVQGIKNKIADTIVITETRSGNKTLKFNNLLIHSLYDPEKESVKFAQKIQQGNKVFFIWIWLRTSYQVHFGTPRFEWFSTCCRFKFRNFICFLFYNRPLRNIRGPTFLFDF